MEQIWLDFRNKYQGEQTTREAFNQLSVDLLERHFPGKIIEATTSISDNITDEKSRVLYQTKFFLEDLSNSRKGQIRKAFNDSIYAHNQKKHPLFAWVLCVPMIFNEEESLWWYNWKSKMTEEYQVNIQLFDGEFIKELLDKYSLYDKWFGILSVEEKKEPEIKTETNEIFSSSISNDLFEIEEDSEQELITENEKTEEIVFEIERKKEEEYVEEEIHEEEKTEVEIQNNLIEETEQSEKSDISEEKIEEPDLYTEIEADELSREGFFTIKTLKKQHHEIQKHKDSLNENQKSEFENIFRKNKIPKDRFEFDKIEINEVSTVDLIFKAKQFKINEQYEKALFVYENILQREDLKEDAKVDTIQEIDFCEKMAVYRNKISEGDIYFAKGEYLKALQCYEVSYNLNNQRKEIIKKYNYTYAEALVLNKNYEPAIEKYEEALKIEPNNQVIQDKRAFARLMHTGNKVFKKAPASYLNPLISPFFYFQARNFDKSNADLNYKIVNIRKNFIYVLVAFLCLTVLIVLIQSIPPVKEELVLVDSKKAVSMYEYSMQSGDYYLQNYTENSIHLLDSAIYSYKNAIRYKPYDSIAPLKVAEAKALKDEYIARAQELIFLDSAAYFISMRDPSEGLRLFKFLFEPYNKSSGKFGYVDEELNIVVPPIFDFNYKKMLDVGERFKDGKAFVCIEISQGDTLYFYIDKNSNRVE